MDRDFTGAMLSVARKPVRYHLFAAEVGPWSTAHDLALEDGGLCSDDRASLRFASSYLWESIEAPSNAVLSQMQKGRAGGLSRAPRAAPPPGAPDP
jgi:hypothetical protein